MANGIQKKLVGIKKGLSEEDFKLFWAGQFNAKKLLEGRDKPQSNFIEEESEESDKDSGSHL